jgi:hypothetical protein
MKKFKISTVAAIALYAMLAAVLSSCNGATDHKKCLDNVKRVYPNSKIYKSPKSSFKFYVVDSMGVREVTTLNLSNPNIDGITEFVVVE